MFPLHDDNPTRSTPVVTYLIIATNVVVFFYQLAIGLDVSALQFGLIPAELLHDADRVYTGARLGLPPGVGVVNYDPAWVTLFTSMFMHGSWLHILGNMWYLWIFGNNVEDALGKVRFLVFYLLCGLGAAFAQVLVTPDSPVPMVGASGAIAGVLGAYLVLYPGSRVTTLVTLGFFWTTMVLPAGLVLGFWFLIQVINGLVLLGPSTRGGGVAYAAHVGGFVVGYLLVRVFAEPRRERAPRRYLPPDDWDWR